MSFNRWLDTLIDEKGLDLEKRFEKFSKSGVPHSIPFGSVVEFWKSCDTATKAQIKHNLVMTDFHDGDMYHFAGFTAQFLADQYEGILS